MRCNIASRRAAEVVRWVLGKRSTPYVRLPVPFALLAGEAFAYPADRQRAIWWRLALEPDDFDLGKLHDTDSSDVTLGSEEVPA